MKKLCGISVKFSFGVCYNITTVHLHDFWTGAAQDMLVAIMVYLWKTSYELKTFGRVVRLVNSVQYKDGKIDELCEFARCLKNHAIEYPNDVTSVNWASIQGTPQETLGSICKTLSTRLRLWAIEDVDELTATDEMDFDPIIATSISCAAPVQKSSFSPSPAEFFINRSAILITSCSSVIYAKGLYELERLIFSRFSTPICFILSCSNV